MIYVVRFKYTNLICAQNYLFNFYPLFETSDKFTKSCIIDMANYRKIIFKTLPFWKCKISNSIILFLHFFDISKIKYSKTCFVKINACSNNKYKRTKWKNNVFHKVYSIVYNANKKEHRNHVYDKPFYKMLWVFPNSFTN